MSDMTKSFTFMFTEREQLSEFIAKIEGVHESFIETLKSVDDPKVKRVLETTYKGMVSSLKCHRGFIDALGVQMIKEGAEIVDEEDE